MFNSFGFHLRLTTFGESHGEAIGGILDGLPAGLEINTEEIQKELNRRKPGFSELVTPRKEEDIPEIFSGIFEGKTTGAPVGFIIRNKDVRSKDYHPIKNIFRPSHADYTWKMKYGIRDYRGGGRSSAREMAVRIVAGSIAKQFLSQHNIRIQAYIRQIGLYKTTIPPEQIRIPHPENEIRCPDTEASEKMKNFLKDCLSRKDSAGGIVECQIHGLPVGLGEPVYGKFSAVLATSVFSINAVKGFEIGSGFSCVTMPGSEHNDVFDIDSSGNIITHTNHSGGIQGGMTNGMPVIFRVAFKPTSSIGKKQRTLDECGQPTEIEIQGRHDPCVAIRAVPVVEAMAALVCADMLLISRMNKVKF